MLEFAESVTVEMPEFDSDQIAEFSESASKGLIIEVAAIHAGVTANGNNYAANELEKGLESWIQPYPRPIIINHDIEAEPLGRMITARMAQEVDGTPFTMLQAAIVDPIAAQKVLDKRYLTGSVGGRAGKAICSICGKDWANASMFELPCRHERMQVYKGKLCTFDMQDISWREWSFVNAPADNRSSVRGVIVGSVAESEGGIEVPSATKAHVYTIDLDSESVTEFLGDGKVRNVLESLKPRQAKPHYHILRGSYLTAVGYADAETEENEMPEENDDDILAVTESLQADTPEEEPEVEEEGAPEEEAPEETPEDAPEATPEDEPVATDTETPAEDEPTGEPGTNDGVKDDGEPPLALPEEEPEEEPAPEEEPEEEAAPETPEGQETPNAPDEEPRIPPSRESADVAALLAENERLKEENAKAKQMLKRTLATSVVERKIELGIAKSDQRASLIDEHITRTASSLRDSLKDMEGAKVVAGTEGTLEITPTVALVSDNDGKVLTSEDEVQEGESPSTPQDKLVDVLVDRLMKRGPQF